ncbi:hypothetical protein MTO96_000931 [Rhipicephalus appendiculatus]
MGKNERHLCRCLSSEQCQHCSPVPAIEDRAAASLAPHGRPRRWVDFVALPRRTQVFQQEPAAVAKNWQRTGAEASQGEAGVAAVLFVVACHRRSRRSPVINLADVPESFGAAHVADSARLAPAGESDPTGKVALGYRRVRPVPAGR